MSNDEILQGNRLIAEFDGYEYSEESFLNNIKGVLQKDGKLSLHANLINKSFCTEYHSSWNWIMQIVQKIEDKGYCVFIQNDCCWMQVGRAGMKMPIITNLADCKMDAIYKTVLDFIKWHNQKS